MQTDKTNLFLVVHHGKDSNQPWRNSWKENDDACLEAIQTTLEIGRLCQTAKETNRLVYVHRCAWNEEPPSICCIAAVLSVDRIDSRTCLVTFERQQIVQETPPTTPRLGQNYYWA